MDLILLLSFSILRINIHTEHICLQMWDIGQWNNNKKMPGLEMLILKHSYLFFLKWMIKTPKNSVDLN